MTTVPSGEIRSRAGRSLVAVDILLAVTLLVALLSWFFDPFRLSLGPAHLTVGWGPKPMLAPVLVLALRVFLARREERRGGRLIRCSLSLGTVLVVLVALEGLLAVLGVERGPHVFEVRKRDGEPVQGGGSMVFDDQLLWRFKAGAMFHGRRINSMGFLDREVAPAKAPGTRRVVCMGDSCTAQGMPPYAGHLDGLLKASPPDAANWEAFNTAVHGYTVLQGLRLFNLRVRDLRPDVVTIYFGWNDHWLNEVPDKQRMAWTASPFSRAVRDAVLRKRISALLQRDVPDAAGQVLRVAPADYERGLSDLIRAVRRAGAVPLVLTAPRAHTLTGLLVHNRQAESVEEAIRLHDEYAEITRRVAASERAPLLDLAAAFAGPEHDALFSRDGIHFENAGRRRIAELIHQELQSSVFR